MSDFTKRVFPAQCPEEESGKVRIGDTLIPFFESSYDVKTMNSALVDKARCVIWQNIKDHSEGREVGILQDLACRGRTADQTYSMFISFFYCNKEQREIAEMVGLGKWNFGIPNLD